MAEEIINTKHPLIMVLRENHHVILGGISFLNDKEVAALLKVSRRTVQNYRDAGIIPYYIICGKCLYAETDVQKLIESNYHPRYDDTITR